MSIAAENVIGGVLCKPEAFWRVCDIVSADDFPASLRRLWVRIEEMVRSDETVDSILLAEEGFQNAIELEANTHSVANIEVYARKLAEASEMRRVREAGRRISECDSYSEAQSLLSEAKPDQVARIKTAKEALKDMYEVLKARMESGDSITGVPTGVDGLDQITSGYQPGNLIVLVGETSMGKSTLAMIHALAAAKHAKEKGSGKVLYFSLEMTTTELLEREIAHLADFPLKWITKPADAPDQAAMRIAIGAKEAVNLPLIVDDRSGLTLEQIESMATQLHMQEEGGLTEIIVDYMHIMGRPRRNDVVELGAIASGLKNLAKRLGVPVIALHQLNRSVSDGKARRPTLDNIRASGEIAEAANVVIAIYRSEIANPDFDSLHGYAEALVLKNRQGERNVRAWMTSRLGNMRLDSCDPPEGYDEKITPDKTPESQPAGSGFRRKMPGSKF